MSGVAQSDLRIRASSTGPTPVAYSGERTARTDFQTRFICLCDSVRHSIESSNGRVWLVPALDQVVRGAEMLSDRDTAQPGSPHVLVVSISLGRS